MPIQTPINSVPLLVGPAGVGKTAVVEGYTDKIQIKKYCDR